MGMWLWLFGVVVECTVFVLESYHGTRRGEDGQGYHYNCPGCRHAAECIIEIGRKKDDA